MFIFFISAIDTTATDTPSVYAPLPANSVRAGLSEGQSNEQGGEDFTAATTEELVAKPSLQMATFEFPTFGDYELGVNNKYKPYNQTIGYKLGFAEQWSNESSDPFYMITHGLGGSNIDPFLPRRYGSYADIDGVNGLYYKTLYGSLLPVGVQQILDSGKRFFLNHVFWLQGENDSFVSRVSGYSDLFDKKVAQWRKDLGNTIYIIIGTIIETDANDVAINDVFRAKALNDPYITVLEISHLPHKGDNLHYNKESLKIIAGMIIEEGKNATPIELTQEWVDANALPDTMTLLTVNESGGNLTITADLEDGDRETIPESQTFKIYDGATLLATTGTATADADVSIVKASQSYTVTIQNISVTSGTKNITITSLDSGGRESVKSNIIQIVI